MSRELNIFSNKRKMEILEELKKKHPKGRWLGILAEDDQYIALRYLLDNEEFTSNDLDFGLRVAIENIAPKCLDIFLKYAAKKKVKFPCEYSYDCLYLFGRQDRKGKLLDCTRVFLSNGLDVKGNIKTSGWYLLFIVLKQAVQDHRENESFDVEFECLSELLEAGADPNFGSCDYNKLATLDRQVYEKSMLQRFGNFTPFHHGANYHKYFTQCVELFVKHGCDCSEKNNGGDSLLDAYFESMHFLYRSFHTMTKFEDFSPFIQKAIGCFIFGGANICHRYKKERLGLTYFILSLMVVVNDWCLDNVQHDKHQMRKITEDVLETVCPFLKFMGVAEAQKLIEECLHTIDFIDEYHVLADFRPIFENAFAKHLTSFFSLETICLLKVFNCAGRRFFELRLPVNLKDSMKAMLFISL